MQHGLRRAVVSRAAPVPARSLSSAARGGSTGSGSSGSGPRTSSTGTTTAAATVSASASVGSSSVRSRLAAVSRPFVPSDASVPNPSGFTASSNPTPAEQPVGESDVTEEKYLSAMQSFLDAGDIEGAEAALALAVRAKEEQLNVELVPTENAPPSDASVSRRLGSGAFARLLHRDALAAASDPAYAPPAPSTSTNAGGSSSAPTVASAKADFAALERGDRIARAQLARFAAMGQDAAPGTAEYLASRGVGDAATRARGRAADQEDIVPVAEAMEMAEAGVEAAAEAAVGSAEGGLRMQHRSSRFAALRNLGAKTARASTEEAPAPVSASFTEGDETVSFAWPPPRRALGLSRLAATAQDSSTASPFGSSSGAGSKRVLPQAAAASLLNAATQGGAAAAAAALEKGLAEAAAALRPPASAPAAVNAGAGLAKARAVADALAAFCEVLAVGSGDTDLGTRKQAAAVSSSSVIDPVAVIAEYEKYLTARGDTADPVDITAPAAAHEPWASPSESSTTPFISVAASVGSEPSPAAAPTPAAATAAAAAAVNTRAALAAMPAGAAVDVISGDSATHTMLTMLATAADSAEATGDAAAAQGARGHASALAALRTVLPETYARVVAVIAARGGRGAARRLQAVQRGAAAASAASRSGSAIEARRVVDSMRAELDQIDEEEGLPAGTTAAAATKGMPLPLFPGDTTANTPAAAASAASAGRGIGTPSGEAGRKASGTAGAGLSTVARLVARDKHGVVVDLRAEELRLGLMVRYGLAAEEAGRKAAEMVQRGEGLDGKPLYSPDTVESLGESENTNEAADEHAEWLRKQAASEAQSSTPAAATAATARLGSAGAGERPPLLPGGTLGVEGGPDASEEDQIKLAAFDTSLREYENMLRRRVMLLEAEREAVESGAPTLAQLTDLSVKVAQVREKVKFDPHDTAALKRANELYRTLSFVQQTKRTNPTLYYWRKLLAQMPAGARDVAMRVHDIPNNPVAWAIETAEDEAARRAAAVAGDAAAAAEEEKKQQKDVKALTNEVLARAMQRIQEGREATRALEKQIADVATCYGGSRGAVELAKLPPQARARAEFMVFLSKLTKDCDLAIRAIQRSTRNEELTLQMRKVQEALRRKRAGFGSEADRQRDQIEEITRHAMQGRKGLRWAITEMADEAMQGKKLFRESISAPEKLRSRANKTVARGVAGAATVALVDPFLALAIGETATAAAAAAADDDADLGGAAAPVSGSVEHALLLQQNKILSQQRSQAKAAARAAAAEEKASETDSGFDSEEPSLTDAADVADAIAAASAAAVTLAEVDSDPARAAALAAARRLPPSLLGTLVAQRELVRTATATTRSAVAAAAAQEHTMSTSQARAHGLVGHDEEEATAGADEEGESISLAAVAPAAAKLLFGRVVGGYGARVLVEQVGARAYARHAARYAGTPVERLLRAAGRIKPTDAVAIEDGAEQVEVDEEDVKVVAEYLGVPVPAAFTATSAEDDEGALVSAKATLLSTPHSDPASADLVATTATGGNDTGTAMAAAERARQGVSRPLWQCTKSRHMQLLCGDYVLFDPLPARAWGQAAGGAPAAAVAAMGAPGDGVVKGVFKRLNEVRRGVAVKRKGVPMVRDGSTLTSNVDHLVVLCAAEGQPPLSPFLLDRFIAMGHQAGVPVTIVYNKIDLLSSVAAAADEAAKQDAIARMFKEKPIKNKKLRRQLARSAAGAAKKGEDDADEEEEWSGDEGISRLHEEEAEDLPATDDEEGWAALEAAETDARRLRKWLRRRGKASTRSRSALLPEEVDALLLAYQGLGYRVVRTSAATGEGVEELKRVISQYHTTAVMGPSGVGKSSLLAALLPSGTEIRTHTLTVSGQGQHTTTAANLYRLPTGGCVVDTPGSQSFVPDLLHNTSLLTDGASAGPSSAAASTAGAVMGGGVHGNGGSGGGGGVNATNADSHDLAASEHALSHLFPEIARASTFCRLGSKCTHVREPGCAVKELVGKGSDHGVLTVFDIYNADKQENVYVRRFWDDLRSGALRPLATLSSSDPLMVFAAKWYRDWDAGVARNPSHKPLDTHSPRELRVMGQLTAAATAGRKISDLGTSIDTIPRKTRVALNSKEGGDSALAAMALAGVPMSATAEEALFSQQVERDISDRGSSAAADLADAAAAPADQDDEYEASTRRSRILEEAVRSGVGADGLPPAAGSPAVARELLARRARRRAEGFEQMELTEELEAVAAKLQAVKKEEERAQKFGALRKMRSKDAAAAGESAADANIAAAVAAAKEKSYTKEEDHDESSDPRIARLFAPLSQPSDLIVPVPGIPAKFYAQQREARAAAAMMNANAAAAASADHENESAPVRATIESTAALAAAAARGARPGVSIPAVAVAEMALEETLPGGRVVRRPVQTKVDRLRWERLWIDKHNNATESEGGIRAVRVPSSTFTSSRQAPAGSAAARAAAAAASVGLTSVGRAQATRFAVEKERKDALAAALDAEDAEKVAELQKTDSLVIAGVDLNEYIASKKAAAAGGAVVYPSAAAAAAADAAALAAEASAAAAAAAAGVAAPALGANMGTVSLLAADDDAVGVGSGRARSKRERKAAEAAAERAARLQKLREDVVRVGAVSATAAAATAASGSSFTLPPTGSPSGALTFAPGAAAVAGDAVGAAAAAARAAAASAAAAATAAAVKPLPVPKLTFARMLPLARTPASAPPSSTPPAAAAATTTTSASLVEGAIETLRGASPVSTTTPTWVGFDADAPVNFSPGLTSWGASRLPPSASAHLMVPETRYQSYLKLRELLTATTGHLRERKRASTAKKQARDEVGRAQEKEKAEIKAYRKVATARELKADPSKIEAVRTEKAKEILSVLGDAEGIEDIIDVETNKVAKRAGMRVSVKRAKREAVMRLNAADTAREVSMVTDDLEQVMEAQEAAQAKK